MSNISASRSTANLSRNKRMKQTRIRAKSAKSATRKSNCENADSPTLSQVYAESRFQLDKTKIDCCKNVEKGTKSAVMKFFATELSDDDDDDDDEDAGDQIARKCNFIPNKEKQKNSLRRSRYSRFADKPNIDSSTEATSPFFIDDDDSYNVISREYESIIHHRPTRSTRMQPDYFTPKLTRRGRHNCDDNLDVTRRHVVTHCPLPVPMSVLSERYQENLSLPLLPEKELYSFGEIYEANLLQHVHKYLEVDTYHRVAYVGQQKGSIASKIEDYFCLMNPIKNIYPGKMDYKDVRENQKLLAFNIAHVGAEEFFTQASSDQANVTFDRIIFNDSVQYFTNIETTLHHVLKTLHKFGKILIIHRPGSLNTLPYFEAAKDRISKDETPYMKIITSLQKTGADVEWDLVHVPIVIRTSKWLAMLKAKYPPQMEIMSNHEITCGLRELTEGSLKYLQDENMEVEDRLMFISASLSTFDCAYPSVQRVGGASQMPYSGVADANYQLSITDDIKCFLEQPKLSQYKMKSLF